MLLLCCCVVVLLCCSSLQRVSFCNWEPFLLMRELSKAVLITSFTLLIMCTPSIHIPLLHRCFFIHLGVATQLHPFALQAYFRHTAAVEKSIEGTYCIVFVYVCMYVCMCVYLWCWCDVGVLLVSNVLCMNFMLVDSSCR